MARQNPSAKATSVRANGTAVKRNADAMDDQNTGETEVNGHTKPGTPSDNNLRSLVDDMMQTTHKRQDAKRQAVDRDRKSAINDVLEALTRLHEEHQAKLSNLRCVKLQRLAQLLQEKAEIEVKVMQSVHALMSAYDAANQEFDTCLERKIQDLSEASVS